MSLVSPAAVPPCRCLAYSTRKVQYTSLRQQTCHFSWYKTNCQFLVFVEGKWNWFLLLFEFRHFFPPYSSSHAVNYLFSVRLRSWKIYQENKLSHMPSLQNDWQRFLALLSSCMAFQRFFVCFFVFLAKGMQSTTTLDCSSLPCLHLENLSVTLEKKPILSPNCGFGVFLCLGLYYYFAAIKSFFF